jgi:hypothetical protein
MINIIIGLVTLLYLLSWIIAITHIVDLNVLGRRISQWNVLFDLFQLDFGIEHFWRDFI